MYETTLRGNRMLCYATNPFKGAFLFNSCSANTLAALFDKLTN